MAKDQTLKIIDMQSFIGGEADNPYMGPKNCCAKAVGVDLRSKPGLVQLEKDLEEVFDFGGDVGCITNIKDLGNEYERYFISYDTSTPTQNKCDLAINKNGTFEVMHTFNGPTNIKSIAFNEGEGDNLYLYYYGIVFSGWAQGVPNYDIKVYRSEFYYGQNQTITGKANGEPHTFIEKTTIRDIPAENSDACIYTMNVNGRIYIAFGNAIRTQDDNEVFTEEMVMPVGETIVGMTEYLGTIKIYTTLGQNMYMYTWDGVDYLPTTRQVWEGMSVRFEGGILNNGAYDYLVTKDGSLYLIAGTQKQKIMVSNGGVKKYLYKLLGIKDDILYMSDNDGFIYTYGTKFPGFSNSLVSSYDIAETRCNFMYGEYFVGIKKLYRVSDSYCNAEHDITRWNSKTKEWTRNSLIGGYIQTMFYTVDQWKNMAFEMMKMKVDVKNYGTVLILYRTDVTNDWRLFKEIDRNYDNEKISISIREFNDDDPGAFTGIQFMFVLQRDKIFGHLESTPEIGRCTAFLREIDENI